MSLYTEKKEQELIAQIMELLVTHHGGELSEEELDRKIDALERAISIAKSSHQGQLRKSGEPYFFHPLRVAHLAARHWMHFDSITAAILHDVVEDTPVTLEEVEEDFGAEVALLVNGLTKATDEGLSKEALKAKTYRKQLLAAIEDVRVLCLKFWDRIDNLQTISALLPQKQLLIAEETHQIYVPLALHLGMGVVAADLDALSLNILYPRRARRYRSTIQGLKEQFEEPLRDIRVRLKGAFDQHKLPVVMKDRWRAFSVAAVQSMGRGLSTLYTLEIMVDGTMDAYSTLGVLHSTFLPIPGKLRDHLHVPSQFGYLALKTTVQAGEHRIRIEITTRKLARFNDSGVLAPGFVFRKANFEGLMRSLLEGESAVTKEGLGLASNTIQVYTPAGDVRTLPEGSSVLDFAFDIHEELGLHATRAKVNGNSRFLRSKLMDGDQVSILRSSSPQVLPKWLDWAITPKAQNSIRKYLRGKVSHSQ